MCYMKYIFTFAVQTKGFDPELAGTNAGAMLGKGLYITTSLQKALNYAGRFEHEGAVFKLQVDLGRCYQVQKNDSNMKTWMNQGYDSAWSPANVNGEREENCISDPRSRVHILTIIPGNTWASQRAGYYVQESGLLIKR